MDACIWKNPPVMISLLNQREFTQTSFSYFINYSISRSLRIVNSIGLSKIEKQRVRGCGCKKEEEYYVITEGDKNYAKVLRESQPYFSIHRDRIFVILISAQIIANATLNHFHAILKDIAFLHHLGIRFVLVPCTDVKIDKLLIERGSMPKYVGRYRITDDESLKAAIKAAEGIKFVMEAKLSPGPSMFNIRRHSDNSRLHDIGVSVASGNFLAAKRRGVVGGIDYGSTGEVEKVDVTLMRERLDSGCIVILTNLGYSSSGEVLNCNTYEVATACALAIGADKLICVIDGPILDENGRLIRFLPLEEADMLIRKRAKQCETAANYVKAVDEEGIHNGVGFENGDYLGNSEQGFAIGGQERLSQKNSYLSELAAATFVCRGGVQRVHLLDGTISGVLLLELCKRDGMGTMVASDLYEGTRTAHEKYISGIKQIIQPLVVSGILVEQTFEELLKNLENFVVVERECQIIACGVLVPYFGESCGEVVVIAESPDCCGQEQEDKLLDHMEKKASSLGLNKLFLLTTCTADWFVRRGFSESSIDDIPVQKRKTINLSWNLKYYMKKLPPNESRITVGQKLASK